MNPEYLDTTVTFVVEYRETRNAPDGEWFHSSTKPTMEEAVQASRPWRTAGDHVEWRIVHVVTTRNVLLAASTDVHA